MLRLGMVVIPSTTDKKPTIENVINAPPPDPARIDMRSLLVRCPHCFHHYVSKHSDFIIKRNFRLGSKRSPMRSKCLACHRVVHVHSTTADHAFAEVESRKLRQVADLLDVAEACNIEYASTGKCSTHEMYRIWRLQTRNTDSNAVPLPFKRWTQRGGR